MPVNTPGSTREFIDLAIEARETLIRQDVLVGDPRRWRPRWFDGRFLAASDLQGEQNYFLVRQADLARAGGSGIIDGLAVSEVVETGTGLARLRIEPGQGVTDTGELVVLLDALEVSPADIPEMQRLDAAFGLQVVPNEAGRTRTGLYILALRAVEWTANPIGAYPTSLTGTRTSEDSTIVEGVAVSLIPYPDESVEGTRWRRRAKVARDIFVDGRDHGAASGVLPIAMVAMRGNTVDWVDPFLVRRETGAERPAGMDFGFGARALRESHLLQYQRHLVDVLNEQGDRPFAAGAYFDALPPIGQFPASAIDANALTQRFFPAGIDVELSFIPEDELPALIEESLLMPPLDLTAGLDALEGVGVIVLIPLARPAFMARKASLPNWDEELPRLRVPVRDLRARATPRELLLANVFVPAVRPSAPPPEEPWRELLRTAAAGQLLWYVRRRHLPIPSNVAGTPVTADSPSVSDPIAFSRVLAENPEIASGVDRLRRIEAPEVAVLTRRLAEPRFVGNPALLRTLVARAAGPEGSTPNASDAVAALAPAADPRLGEGLGMLPAPRGTESVLDKLMEAGALGDVDRLTREVPQENLKKFSTELRKAVRAGGDVPTILADLRARFVP